MRDDRQLEKTIHEQLADPNYEGHPLRESLHALFQNYQDQLTQLERLTAISDGFQSAMRERNHSITERYRKQMRQLQKIVRISDHYQQMMRDMNESLKIASTQDPLTGLPNRRLMLDRLNAEVALAQRRSLPFTLALIDIDHFKLVNDQFGHDAGDAALIAVSRALAEGLRAYDVCARWGGEEFLVLLPETPGPGALIITERLRRKVATLRHEGTMAALQSTVSIGVAEHAPDAILTDTIKRADDALYEAKRTGRNRVVVAK